VLVVIVGAASVAEPGIIVEPGSVNPRVRQGRLERRGDLSGPGGGDGLAEVVITVDLAVRAWRSRSEARFRASSSRSSRTRSTQTSAASQPSTR
jgi:hypothetical protein